MTELHQRLGDSGEGPQQLGALLAGAAEWNPSAALEACAGTTRTAPLSFAQERMWTLHQLHPDSPLYNINGVLELEGDLRLDALRGMFAALIRRHEALRTTFDVIDGNALQVVHAAQGFKVPLLDLSQLGVATTAAEVRRIATRESRRTFALATGPLLRALLIRLATERHVVVFTMHHIIADAWSAGVLVREMPLVYESLRAAVPARLEPLPQQYADFATAQRQGVRAELLNRQLGYWSKELDGAPAVLDWPSDRPRPAQARHAGALCEFTIPQPLTSALRELSRRSRVTLFVTLLAAFKVLVHRYTGRTDFIVGSSMANRVDANLEPLVGCFVNSVALRARLYEGETFRQLLAAVRQTVTAAVTNADVPFEAVVDARRPPRNASHAPLFQTMFVMQNVPAEDMALAGLRLKPVRIHNGTSRFDVTMEVADRPQGLAGTIEYDTDLFERDTILRMSRHYESLLEAIVQDPDCRVARLPLSAPPERARLLRAVTPADASTGTAQLLHECFASAAAVTPEAVALVAGRRQVKYREVAARSDVVAAVLHERSVVPGHTIAVIANDPIDTLVMALGALKAGCTYAVTSAAALSARANLLASLQIDLVATDGQCPSVTLTGLPVVSIKASALERPPALPAAMCAAQPPATLACVTVDPDRNDANQAVEITHEAVTRAALHSASGAAARGEIMLCVAPLESVDSLLEVWGTLLNGGCCILDGIAAHSAADIAELVQRHAVSTLKLPSVPLHAVLERADKLASLRTIIYQGGTPSSRLLEGLPQWPRIGSLHALGFAACTGTAFTTQLAAKDCRSGRERRTYFPEEGVQLYVLERDLHLAPFGLYGEIAIGGPYLARGYRGNTKLTAERFIPHPCGGQRGERLYRTGAVGRYLSDGGIELLSVAGERIVVSDYVVHARQIESAIYANTDVQQAVVTAGRDGEHGLLAYVSASSSREKEVSPAQLRAALEPHLAAHMLPTAIVTDALPLRADRRVDHSALGLIGCANVRGALEVTPRTPSEVALVRIWATVLMRDQVDIHDNFFELGGDSILGIQIAARAHESGLSIQPQQIFEAQTIAKLARLIEDQQPAPVEHDEGANAFALTPIQASYFESQQQAVAHFNQAVMFHLRTPRPESELRRAVARLICEHDALRLRFEKRDAGWMQRCADASAAGVPLTSIQIVDAGPERRAQLVRDIALAAQRSLDVQVGPLVRAVATTDAQGLADSLLLVVHHLAVDAVSWRILVADLAAACGPATADRDLQTQQARGARWRTWAQRLHAYARSDEIAAQARFWVDENRPDGACLPLDFPRSGLRPRQMSVVAGRLSPQQTRAILAQRRSAASVDVEALLLAALTRALARWAQLRQLWVDVERHGREGLFPELDLSRAVGWFTAKFPLAIEYRAGEDLATSLAAAKQALERVPAGGIGYGLLRHSSGDSELQQQLSAQPEPQVGFTYLGQLDSTFDQQSLFEVDDITGADYAAVVGSDYRRSHLFDVMLSVVRGAMTIACVYDPSLHAASTVGSLVDSLERELRALSVHRSLQALKKVATELSEPELEALLTGRPDLEDVFGVGPMQQGMLLRSVFAPAQNPYVEQVAITIDGTLDVALFAACWRETAARHATLRTEFAWDVVRDPVQVVRRAIDIRFCEQDWRDGDHPSLEQYLSDNQYRGLDPGRAPLMRWDLLRVGDSRYHFVWSFHHALLDGWSMALVLGEVFRRYEACHRGAVLDLKRVGGYRDYIRWLGQQDRSAAEAFWRRQLQGFTLPTPLPGAVDRGGLVPQRHGSECLEIDAGTTAKLQAYCRRHQLTLNTLLQGAWALLLHRHSGNSDVVFGTTVSGRPPQLSGVESLVGLFINTLPTRVRIETHRGVSDWLRTIQAEQAQAREFSHASLLEIHRWSELERSAPLFESQLVFENYPTREIGRTVAVKVSDVRVFEHADVALMLLVLPGSVLTLKLRFDRARFRAEAIRVVLERLARLVAAIGADAGRVGALEMLDAEELRTRRSVWNSPQQPRPSRSYPELFEMQADRTPDAVAVASGERRMTYAELNERANRLAHFLLSCAVRAETPIPILLDRTPQMLIAVLGVLKAGAAYVPLDRDLGRRRLDVILREIAPPLLLSRSDLAAGSPAGSAQVIDIDSQWPQIESCSGENPALPIHAGQLAYVIYTSGSSGEPKGVMATHRGLANYVSWCVNAYEVARGEGSPVLSPLTFDLTVTSLLVPLAAGKQVSLLHGANEIESLAAALNGTANYSLVKITPAHLELLGRVASVQAARASRALVIGGEALRGEMLQHWRRHAPDVRVVNEYGPTEATVGCCTYVAAAADVADGPLPIGRPIANTRIYVLDQELRPVATDVAGEICIGGHGLARGYWRSAALTAERFVPDPHSATPGARLYRTGDRGRMDSGGQICCDGRLDRQLKIRGYRVEPAEIEAAIIAAGCARQVTVDVSDEADGARLTAYVVGNGAGSISATELRRRLAQRLPGYMIPEQVVDLDAMPLTANGKIDRAALRRARLPPRVADASGRDGTRGLERAIANVWQTVLRVEAVDLDANFFDVGGHSLLLAQVQDRLQELLRIEISLLDLYKYPTVRALAKRYANAAASPVDTTSEAQELSAQREHIAVIGMAGRFPGAATIDQLWDNLAAGVESVSTFSDEQLSAAGISAQLLSNGAYVKAHAVLDDVERFDAAFFGMSPREAETTDPQHRVFLECAQHALDDAGYASERHAGRIGVYAGAFLSTYLLQNLLPNTELMQAADMLQLITGTDKDFLPTRVSYKLGLHGPAISVQTACSTSLTAAHLACEALRRGQCDIALAGGVSIRVPQVAGYVHHEQGTLSADGHCRAFAASATGFVGGSGCGIVVLKRLRDALRDRDRIRAVIRGSAINNDGARKVGFTAPSIDGQVEVIRAALADAAVDSASVTYIEAHGTGTPIGDPIEVAALSEAYGRPAEAVRVIGSVKTNIGHLDAAAGVAGLIKAVLQLEHRQIVPSLHCAVPNPRIDFAAGGLQVSSALQEWSAPAGLRRAGVSSFGIGGTNVHMILEEAPARPAARLSLRPSQLLSISGKTHRAVAQGLKRLRECLAKHPEHALADVAYTGHIGRRAFKYRTSLLCHSREDALAALDPVAIPIREAAISGVAFVFPGVEGAYAGMGQRIRAQEPVFRDAVDRCLAMLPRDLAEDVRRVLQSGDGVRESRAPHAIELAVFIIEHAVGQLWIHWGVRPYLLLGHGIGEFAAAVAAEVFELEDALAVLTLHARLIKSHDGAASTEVPRGELTRLLASVRTQPAQLPLFLASSADRITDAEAVDPQLWSTRLLLRPESASLMECIAKTDAQLFLEAGPGRLAAPARRILSGLGGATRDECEVLLRTLGELWDCGVEVDWGRYYDCEQRRRVELPGYPLEGSRFWIEPTPQRRKPQQESAPPSLQKQPDPKCWLYRPGWQRCGGRSQCPSAQTQLAGEVWLTFVEDDAAARAFTEALRAAKQRVIEVFTGEKFRVLQQDVYALAATRLADFTNLIEDLARQGALPKRVVYLWGSGHAGGCAFDTALAGLLHLTQALAAARADRFELTVVTAGAHEVDGEDSLSVHGGALLGFCSTIPLECPRIACRNIDLQRFASSPSQEQVQTSQLVGELLCAQAAPSVALRRSHTWKPTVERITVPDVPVRPCLRQRGVYWITGGTGGVGLDLARYLARDFQARLVLISRHGGSDSGERVCAAVAELERLGAEVVLAPADVGDWTRMHAVMRDTQARFGRVDGVFHAAGSRVAGLLSEFRYEQFSEQMHAKLAGVEVLSELLRDAPADFCVVMSSLAALLGVHGFPAYSAAHRAMDVLARRQDRDSRTPWLVVNLDNWVTTDLQNAARVSLTDRLAMSTEESIEAMRLLLTAALENRHVHVSTADLTARLAMHAQVGNRSAPPPQPADSGRALHLRPTLTAEFRAAQSAAERTLTAVWEELLGCAPIGVDDDFFELGGDSVVSLQIVARAAEFGITLTPQQFFEYPTVAELACAADTQEMIEAEQGIVSGPAPLTPIQHWFFEQRMREPAHWNMAMLLRVRKSVAPAVLRSAVRALLAHHDALRLRYRQTNDGWEQIVAAPGEDVPFSVVDMRFVAEPAAAALVESICSQLQRSLDLTEGPMFRAAYFLGRAPTQCRLALIAHHLTIDAPSWWVLLQDLCTACEQLAAAAELRLPNKTTSYQSWGTRLTHLASSGAFDSELEYWTCASRSPLRPLPVDFTSGIERDTEQTAKVVCVEMDEQQTATLLHDVPHELSTRVHDLLLTAFAASAAEHSGTRELLVELEGVGRDAALRNVDLSRTVGWFTTMYPVLLTLDSENVAECLSSIGEQMRAVPSRGMGFGALRYLAGNARARLAASPAQAEVSFTYLGSGDRWQGTSEGLFVPTEESCGRLHSPHAQLRYRLAVTAVVADGRLRMHWIYSDKLYKAATVTCLAEGCMAKLRQLVADSSGKRQRAQTA